MLRAAIADNPHAAKRSPRPRRPPAGDQPKPLSLVPLPWWTSSPVVLGDDVITPAFAAGATLFALDQIVRAGPPWLGVLRQRQTLAAAASCARLLRMREDEAALRDAVHLTRPGDDPGPAGRLHRAWREASRRPAETAETLGRLARELAIDLRFADHSFVGDAASGPIAAATAASAGLARGLPASQRAAGEPLVLMAADLALSCALRWPTPLPVITTVILDPSLRTGSQGRRARVDDPGWAATVTAAVALGARRAHALAVDLERRAGALTAAASRVRTKAGASGVAALLADDVVAAASLAGLGSDRAARRFLERLQALGGVRELSGRPAFRLYGL